MTTKRLRSTTCGRARRSTARASRRFPYSEAIACVVARVCGISLADAMLTPCGGRRTRLGTSSWSAAALVACTRCGRSRSAVGARPQPDLIRCRRPPRHIGTRVARVPTPRVKGGPPVHSLTPKGRRPCPRHMRHRPPVCRGACGPTPTGSNPLSPPSPSHRDEGGARVDAAGEGGTSGPLSHAERASTVPTPHATQTARSAAAHVGPGIPYFGLCGVGLHGSERTETLCQTHGISLCVGSCVRAFTK